MRKKGKEHRYRAWIFSLCLCAALLAAFAFFIPFAPVILSVTPRFPPSLVIPVTSCGTLNQAGATYSLQNAITLNSPGNCFSITANDIIFDGNGYSVNGVLSISSAGDGFFIQGVRNIFIRNVNIFSFPRGIYFESVNDSALENVSAGSAIRGVLLYNSSRNNLKNVSIFGSSDYALIFAGSSSNVLTYSRVYSNTGYFGAAFFSSTSDHNTISHSAFFDNKNAFSNSYALTIGSNSNSLYNLTFINNSLALKLANASYNNLDSLVFADNAGSLTFDVGFNGELWYANNYNRVSNVVVRGGGGVGLGWNPANGYSNNHNYFVNIDVRNSGGISAFGINNTFLNATSRNNSGGFYISGESNKLYDIYSLYNRNIGVIIIGSNSTIKNAFIFNNTGYVNSNGYELRYGLWAYYQANGYFENITSRLHSSDGVFIAGTGPVTFIGLGTSHNNGNGFNSAVDHDLTIVNATTSYNTGLGLAITSFGNVSLENIISQGNANGLALNSATNLTNVRLNNVTVTDSTGDGMFINHNRNATFMNVRAYNNAGSDFAVLFSEISLINPIILSYRIGSTRLSYESFLFGKIAYNDLIGTSNPYGGTFGNNLYNDIFVYYNNASVQSQNNPDLNRPALVTLRNLPTNFTNPEIKRNGVSCPANICTSLTNLNAGTVIFSVNSWSSYCIGNVNSSCSANNLSLPGPGPQPQQVFADLIVFSFAISNIWNTSSANYSVNYSLVLSNIGNGTAAPSAASINTSGNFTCAGNSPCVGATSLFSVPSLTPGQSYSKIITQQLATTGGNFTAAATADVNAQVTEWDENNNVATLSFFIASNGSSIVTASNNSINNTSSNPPASNNSSNNTSPNSNPPPGGGGSGGSSGGGGSGGSGPGALPGGGGGSGPSGGGAGPVPGGGQPNNGSSGPGGSGLLNGSSNTNGTGGNLGGGSTVPGQQSSQNTDIVFIILVIILVLLLIVVAVVLGLPVLHRDQPPATPENPY